MEDDPKVYLPNGNELHLRDPRITGVDPAVTAGSNKVVLSGAVATAIKNIAIGDIFGHTAIGDSTTPIYFTGISLMPCDLSHTYAPYSSGGYLPLTGGTLTNAALGEALIIKRDANNADSAIKYINAGGSLGYMGITSNGDPYYRTANGANSYTFFHTGNAGTGYPWGCTTLTATGAVTLQSTLNVTGAATLSSTLSVAASATIASIFIGNTNEINGVNTPLYLNYNSGSDIRMLVGGSGNVGIKGVPSYDLHVYGNIVATGLITSGSASDKKLKTNIKSLDLKRAKAIVLNARPVSFTWNKTATELYDKNIGDDIGLIAQEVEPYLPEAVDVVFDKYKRLDYTKFIAPLIKIIQDQEARIQALEELANINSIFN